MNMFVLNVFAFVFVFAFIFILRLFTKPIKRGFFCNDVSIRMPYYKNESFGWITIWTISFGLAMLIFITSHALKKSKKMFSHIFAEFIPFTFGFLVNVLISHFVKTTTGRLRPCFIELCKPNVLQSQCLLTPNLYTEDFECTSGEYSDVFARGSFFSGRASSIAFSAVYLLCYLQHHLPQLPTFARAFCQLSLVIIAFLLSTSSLFDYHHFWEDILVGDLVGTVIALFTYSVIRSTANTAGKYEETQCTEHSPRKCSSVGQLSTSEQTPLTEQWHSLYRTL